MLLLLYIYLAAPFGQMPLYEENGKVGWQSLAIARYVAKKVKLVGDTDWENLEIDAIADTITDLRLSKYACKAFIFLSLCSPQRQSLITIIAANNTLIISYISYKTNN